MRKRKPVAGQRVFIIQLGDSSRFPGTEEQLERREVGKIAILLWAVSEDPVIWLVMQKNGQAVYAAAEFEPASGGIGTTAQLNTLLNSAEDEPERRLYVAMKQFCHREVPSLWQSAYKHGWVIQRTSCICGGNWAWLKPVPATGAYKMVGCVCHTELPWFDDTEET